MKWTVARFPNGSWSTGGAPDCADYAECEVWVIEAKTREEATKKAQAKRAYAKRKRAFTLVDSQMYQQEK